MWLRQGLRTGLLCGCHGLGHAFITYGLVAANVAAAVALTGRGVRGFGQRQVDQAFHDRLEPRGCLPEDGVARLRRGIPRVTRRSARADALRLRRHLHDDRQSPRPPRAGRWVRHHPGHHPRHMDL